MAQLRLAACFLVLASCGGISFGWRPSFLAKYNYDVMQKRLEDQYFAKHHMSHTLKESLQWFEQKLDHFIPSNADTWKQQYAVNTDYYKDNGVVFLHIEGEAPMSSVWVTHSAMADYARKYGAATFALEHRFYGASKPKPDLSIDSLRYLSSEQALADIASFITRMNTQYGFSNPKWIVFGGSYPGSLATWVRYKYPHLVFAAVSSSSPVEATAEYKEYFPLVAKALAGINPECVNAIKAANHELSIGVTDVVKRGEFREIFRLCEPLEDNEMDIISFLKTLRNVFASAVQYNWNIKGLCDIMANSKIKSPVERYAQAFKSATSQFRDDCYDHRYVESLRDFTDMSIPQEYTIWRQWLYQLCTEFGFFPTSKGEDDVFGDKITVKFYIDTCADVYGPHFNESFLYRSIEETNVYYGARSLPVERVIFTWGSLDPWSAIGFTSEPPHGCYAILINGTSHCEDMGSASEFDPPQMVKAKSKISEIIGDWLNDKNRWTRKRSIVHF